MPKIFSTSTCISLAKIVKASPHTTAILDHVTLAYLGEAPRSLQLNTGLRSSPQKLQSPDTRDWQRGKTLRTGAKLQPTIVRCRIRVFYISSCDGFPVFAFQNKLFETNQRII